ncbi:MAG: hypothetical protein ABI064_04660, partial [Acidobacteriaceae bacterium]
AKLLDFGIATMVREGSARQLKSADVSEGYSPSFASHEQRAGRPVSVATDIYGLGLLALVLLPGVAPVEASAFSSPDARVQEAPSKTLKRLGREARGEIATARSTTPAAFVRAIAGDLDAILLKALDADPDHRYLTVEEMSDDLRRHLAGWPILARPTTRLDRTRKWMGRHKLLAAESMLLAAIILFSIIGVLWQSAKAAHERSVAQIRLHDLVRLTGTLDGELYASLNTLPQSGPTRTSLLAAATQTLNSLSDTDTRDPVLAIELAGQYQKIAHLEIVQNPPSLAREDATRNLVRGISLLRTVPASSGSYNLAQSQLRAMLALQQALHP